jgi:hypothetical protein
MCRVNDHLHHLKNTVTGVYHGQPVEPQVHVSGERPPASFLKALLHKICLVRYLSGQNDSADVCGSCNALYNMYRNRIDKIILRMCNWFTPMVPLKVWNRTKS